MTALTGIQLDPNVDENTGAFVVVPAGKYKACIVADELKDNSKKTGKLLEMKVQIVEGQFAGQVITDRLNIINPNSTAQAIGQGTLKRICNLCSVPYPPTETAGLMGKPLGIDIRVEEFQSNTLDDQGNPKMLKSNKIASYGPVPTQQAQPTQQQAAPVQNASGW
jgi:hypothetical protein